MTAAAWVDDVPVGIDEVEGRLSQMRARDRARALPDADSREGRQLRRWVTQVIVVERLCEGELDRREGSPLPATPGIPSRADAVALGSIVAAAWAHPAVPAAAQAVSRDVRLSDEAFARATELGGTPEGCVWSETELVASTRLEAFSRWLALATHTQVRLARGYEHPGDSSQPDNLHRH